MEKCRSRAQKGKHPLRSDINGNKFINVRRKMCPLEMLLALVVLCCSIALTESSVDGWTDPPGVIIQDRFSNIKLMCGVNGNKYTSNEMGFFNNSNQQWIDKKYIQVKNVSVIEMFLPNATEQESVIVCKLTNDQGISYNDIKVGRKPENITGLKCLSDDWHDMNCSFEKPHNHVPVQYSLSYRVAGSSQIYFCRPPVEKDPKIFSCFISRGAYRKTSATFEFILTAENDLGTKEQIIVLDNYATVVPAAPNLTAIKINSDSVVLLWEISQNLLVFPKPFDYEFLVVSPAECDPEPKKIRYNNVSSLDDAEQPRNFTHKINLKFANTWYDISIRMKISTANDSEEMWSQWAKKILLPTTTRRPDNPPSVDVGSFNIGRGGDIHIYWKHIPKCYQNAVNYTYIVTSNNKQFEDPNETNQHEAIYIKERVNLMKDTTFTIRSQNAVGMSKEAKTIVIPGESRRLDGPKKIKKILSNGSYYLSWSPPVQHQIEITSYTVFWCVAKSELENKCEGSIDFVRRLPSETYFEFTSNLSVNFAVSANSRDSTSGMVWAKCTTVNSNEIGKIRTIWIPRLTSSEIEVEWKLDCMDSGIVAGYQLEYCPYKEPQTLDCVEPEKKINITGRLDYPKHTLEGLTPYTQYKIIIRMFSNSTMGPPSDPQANTTLEAAPSEVRDLIARNIGNTSVELYWDPPANLNGVLLFYKVWANGKDYKVNGLDFKTVEIDNGFVTRMNYTLKDLFAFTEYDIAVEACTKECSKPSKTKIRTTIGAPGYFKQPSMKVSWDHSVKNYTSAIVTWEEPEFKGGNLDYYEVKTMSKARIDGNTAERIIKTRKRDCHIEELCKDAMVYGISVRAVNFVLTPHSKETQVLIEGSDDEQQCDMDDQVLLRSLMALKQADPHGWYLPGPWSTEVSHSCSGTVFDSKQYVMLMLLMVASIVIITMFFFSYRKIRDMKDILVQMPPGLEDSGNEKGKKGKDNSDMEKMGTPDILRNVDTASINCEDENGQLLKKSLNGSLNGGDCSSSLHSESTRSEGDNHDNEDEIEYGEFENDGITKRCGLQNFNVKTTPNKEIQPILMSPTVMPTSTPIVDKMRNPPLSLPSSGYVCQPPLKVVSPVLPSNNNGNGYVTHSMFNPMQSSGYTPLSAFRKPTISQNYAIEDKINTKTPIVATTDQEGISGYVTHKQLSDFGHRLQ